MLPKAVTAGEIDPFQQAAQTETATAGFTREVLHHLQRARHNPYLRFEAAELGGWRGPGD